MDGDMSMRRVAIYCTKEKPNKPVFTKLIVRRKKCADATTYSVGTRLGV